MAEKKASLTVLGGPLAGTRFVLEGLGPEVLLGADPACAFRLDLAGVSPHHAKVTAGSDGFTIEDAGSVQGLHVNDSLVTGSSPLRNGDIVWLGTPGEADVVMLQCILPTRPAAVAAAPAPASPEPADASMSEDETLALALEQSEGAPVRAEISLHEEASTAFYTADEAAAASASFAAAEAEAADPPPFATGHAGDTELVVAEDETAAQAVPFAIDSPPPRPPATHFEDDTREQSYVFEEDSATVVMGDPDTGASHAVVHEASEFVEESGPTVIMGADPVDLAPPFVSDPPKTEFIPKPALPPPAAVAPPPPPPASAPRAARPAASPASPPAPAPSAVRPARPPGPGASQSIPAPRRPAPRPAPAPPPEEEVDDEAPRGKAAPPMALYAGLGLAALVVIGGGLFVARRFMGGPPPTTLAQAPPTTVAAAPPRTTPAAVATPPPVDTPVETLPEATPAPIGLPTPAAVATPTVPTTTLKAAPTPSPLATATPAAKKGAPTPAPAATPAGPSPEQLRAQQVAGLLGQAEAAVAAGQFDQAIGHLDEVLRLDPGNARASADRASAVSRRAAASKRFVTGRTIVKTEKAAGGLSGFEGAAVQKTPDFSGRIEFEMSPSSGIKAGDAWTLKVYLVNDGKKGIKVSGVTASTVVNGAAGSGGPVTPATREVAPQQRALLGQTSGSWQDGTTTWSTDVLVTASKGDSLQSTISWR